jgi:hypothetical protein
MEYAARATGNDRLLEEVSLARAALKLDVFKSSQAVKSLRGGRAATLFDVNAF